MGLGILEDNYLEHVPGTSVFNDDPNASALSAYEGLDLNKLKHGSGKNAHLVLVPQPSDDPNDPLNWPQWQKHTVRHLARSWFCLMIHSGCYDTITGIFYFVSLIGYVIERVFD